VYAAYIPLHGFGHRSFSNLPVRVVIVKSKHIVPLVRAGTMSVKQAELNEFDQILGEAENDLKDGKHPNRNPLHKPEYQQEKMYTCGDNASSVPDLGFGLRSFNSLPVREEEVKRKTVLPLGSRQVYKETKSMKLSDISKLLKQMEATQHELDKKLQLRDSLIEESSTVSEKDCVPAPQKVPFVGDAIGSVPDRGFGVRGTLNSSKSTPSQNMVTSGNGTKVPVHEENVTRRNVSLLGTEVTYNKAPCPQVHNSVEQHTDRQNIHVSDVEMAGKTTGVQQIASSYSAEQGDLTKIAVAGRKLELGDDASSIPDCGFGLKSWYNSEKNKDGYSESPLRPPHDIPYYVHDGVTPSHLSDGRSNMPSTVKNSYVQGDYIPSVPDLGFGLQKLWANSALSQELERNMSMPKPSHTSTQIHHIQTNNDLNAAEYSLLSQVHPLVTTGEAARQWVGDQGSSISTRGQSNSLAGVGRGSSVTDIMAKKKVDFSVGSGQADVVIKQREQRAESNIAEGNLYIYVLTILVTINFCLYSYH
jgi:hypothetical protein